MADRYPLRIKDVIRLTRLGYGYVRRSLLSGTLIGRIAPSVLHTTKEAVEAWLQCVKNMPPSVALSSESRSL